MLRRTLRLKPRGPDVDLKTFKKLILESAYNEAMAVPPHRQTFQLVDVRREDEIAVHGTAPGSLHIPLSELQETLVEAVDWMEYRRRAMNLSAPSDEEQRLLAENIDLTRLGGPGEKNVVFFCRLGNRTLLSMEMADQLGYNVSHVARGWSEYEGNPLTDDQILAYVEERKSRELQQQGETKPLER